MDADAKKTVLRMIPYGLYILTGEADGKIAAASISWVTQVSFKPPLVAVGVKADSGSHAIIKDAGAFALNILGKSDQAMATTFFKHAERDGNTISGEPFHTGETGAPILDNAPACVECKLIATVEKGDHSVFIGEVVGAYVKDHPTGRPDDATLLLKDLGEKVFYGG